MPKQIIDYSKTIIYKLVCNDLEITDIYVGHTTNFIKRKQNHKNRCNNKNINLLVYEIIRNNGGFENWSMVMIEEINCNNILEALAKERYWIEILKANLNKTIPTRTMKEWYETNKDNIKEYKEQNKDKIKEQMKLWRENNKDKIIEYREENKEDKNKKSKQYYEQNKEQINQTNICECGGKYTLYHKIRHLKTQKHLNYTLIV
jgi:hypothetical protein